MLRPLQRRCALLVLPQCLLLLLWLCCVLVCLCRSGGLRLRAVRLVLSWWKIAGQVSAEDYLRGCMGNQGCSVSAFANYPDLGLEVIVIVGVRTKEVVHVCHDVAMSSRCITGG